MKKYIYNIIGFVPFYLLFFYLLTVPSSCDFESVDCDSTVYDTIKVYDTLFYNDTNFVEKDSIVVDTFVYSDTNYYDSTIYMDSIRFIDSLVFDTVVNHKDSITYDTLIYDSIIVDTNCTDSMTYLLEDLYPNKNQHVGFDNAQFENENDTLTFTYEVRNKAWYTDSLYTKIYVNNHEKAIDTIAHFNFTDWHRKTWQYPDSTANIDIYLYYKQTKIDSISNKIIGE